MALSPDTSGAPPPPSHTPFDFERDVVAASHERPILVDYWAPWCGPCQVLGPTLERLAGEAGEAWRLVKINTDEHQALAAQANIRGIPTVALYSSGEAIATFTGALAEPAIRRWLDEHLPSAEKEQLAHARSLLDAGDDTAARALLETLLIGNPGQEEARMLLAQALVFAEPTRAQALVDGLYVPEAQAVDTLARFLQLSSAPDSLDASPAQSDYLAAADALSAGNLDEALAKLIAVIQHDRSLDDDGARKATVALFTLLGEAHPAVKTHRPAFNRSLY